jgi:hypothetical protein
LTVRFDQPAADSAYSVVVQGNWFTLDRVTEKRADGFDVEFSEAAPQEAALDWQLVRCGSTCDPAASSASRASGQLQLH